MVQVGVGPLGITQVAIYARVSTQDQDCARQVAELTEWAQRRGDTIIEVFAETASGAKNDRQERKKVLELAKQRKIQAVLVSELSRWGRSTEDLLHTVRELADHKVSLLAYTGQSFDLSAANATGQLVLTMLAAISEFERNLLTERIRSGVNHARQKGKKLGRPAHVNRTEVLELADQGKTVRAIAEELRLSPTTVQKIKRQSAS